MMRLLSLFTLFVLALASAQVISGSEDNDKHDSKAVESLHQVGQPEAAEPIESSTVDHNFGQDDEFYDSSDDETFGGSDDSSHDEADYESADEGPDEQEEETGLNLCKDIDEIESGKSKASPWKIKRLASAIFNKAKQAVNMAIEPPVRYVSLMARFSRWYHDYKNIYDRQVRLDGKPLMEPKELIKLEFGKADHELVDGEQKEIEKTGENMDLLYRILVLTASRLEEKIKLYNEDGESRAKVLESMAKREDSDGSELDEWKYDAASSRLKRVTRKAAVSVLQQELTIIARIIILDQMASYVADHPSLAAETGAAGMVASLMLKAGFAHTPFIASYLTNIKLRTAIYLLENPIASAIRSCPMPTMLRDSRLINGSSSDPQSA